MPNPLSSLLSLLELLGKEIKIISAIGGAVEELPHPDQEEIEDMIVNKDIQIINAFAEEPEPDLKNIYISTPPLPRSQKHFFRFFVDGSIRIYFLGTGIEGTRSFPIELAQIGAAVVRREDNGQLTIFNHKNRVILLLPKANQGISDTVWNKIQNFPKPEWLEVVDFNLPDILADTKKDPRDKAGAKARYLMHELEIELIKSTNCNESAWVILDGAVKFSEKDIWEFWKKNPYTIGVAKSFRKDIVFEFGRGPSQRKDITNILAGLPYAHRTVVFKADGGRVAFWYVRLREQKELDYPLMGVVKVEFPCPDKKPISSDLANLISSALVAEKNVTPYGLDRRWHSTLYPIYIAEQVIKNRFFSREVLIGSIKLLRSKIGGVV